MNPKANEVKLAIVETTVTPNLEGPKIERGITGV